MGLWPIFCFRRRAQGGMKQDPLHIGELLEPAIVSLGYELVGVEYRSGGQGGGLLRVYIDSEQGITVNDCQKVSYQVSGVLDVNDPIPGHYTLEVSSPGMDRILFKESQFADSVGEQVDVRLNFPFEGRRKFIGMLAGVQDSMAVVQIGEDEYLLPLENIQRARVIPVFDEG